MQHTITTNDEIYENLAAYKWRLLKYSSWLCLHISVHNCWHCYLKSHEENIRSLVTSKTTDFFFSTASCWTKKLLQFTIYNPLEKWYKIRNMFHLLVETIWSVGEPKTKCKTINKNRWNSSSYEVKWTTFCANGWLKTSKIKQILEMIDIT